MDPDTQAAAEAARGFMPPDEGLALHDAALGVPEGGSPLLEIGAYCGKSTIYLGAAARARGTVVLSLDHHRGSEENQAGWEHHEPDLVDLAVGKMDTLPWFRRTVHDAGLEGTVVAVVGDSPTVGALWRIPLSLLFIARPPRLRDVGPVGRARGPAGHPRRVPRPGRRRPTPVRDLPPGPRQRRLHRGGGHRLAPGPAPHRRGLVSGRRPTPGRARVRPRRSRPRRSPTGPCPPRTGARRRPTR